MYQGWEHIKIDLFPRVRLGSGKSCWVEVTYDVSSEKARELAGDRKGTEMGGLDGDVRSGIVESAWGGR